MDVFEIKLDEINNIFSKNNLGFIYDLKNDRDNGLLLPFFVGLWIQLINLT